MSDYAEIKEEIVGLVKTGKEMFASLANYSKSEKAGDMAFFIKNYEKWYSKALVIVKQLLPDRLDDFVSKYNSGKRKQIDADTYCILDALKTISVKSSGVTPGNAQLSLLGQVRMLEACLECFDSKVQNIRALVQADMFDSEVEIAKHLLKKGFLRASGAICGVVLEKHFAELCEKRSIPVKKKDPSIATYNDLLKDIAYETMEWRRIQRLADIRNLCDHNKDREPTKEEVQELIDGTDRVIKTIF